MGPQRNRSHRLISGALGAALLLGGLTACSSSKSSAESTTGSTTSSDSAAKGEWDGTISALSYNVAGLPDVLSGSNPERNTELIGPLLNDYDLVLMQETWKSPDPNPLAPTRVYHEILESHSSHKYKADMLPQPLGTNKDRPSALLADGLGLFSNYAIGASTHTPWNDCFGGADQSDHGAADCLAMKGFTLTTVTLASGVTVDVYDLHGEAGSNAKDQELQAADFEQLAAFIKEHSQGKAIILGGDTNLHTDAKPENPQDVADTDIWNRFLAATGLTDACAAVKCTDTGRIDKFAFRSSGKLELSAASRKVETERFKRDDGEQLSDHEALAVSFRWRELG